MLSLVFSLGVSIDKKIILGSYENDVYAGEALEKINAIVEKDDVLKNLVKVNSLTIEIKAIEKYKAVCVSYFKNDRQLFRTLDSLNEYYDDLYALPSYRAVKTVAIAPATEESRIKEEAVLVKEAVLEKKREVQVESPKKYSFQEKKAKKIEEPSVFGETWVVYLVVISLILIMFLITVGKSQKPTLKYPREDDEFL